MSSPIALKDVLRVLKKNGFLLVSQKGSHAKYRNKTNPILTVIIPIHGKEIPFGTFRSILRQSNLSIEDFLS